MRGRRLLLSSRVARPRQRAACRARHRLLVAPLPTDSAPARCRHATSASARSRPGKIPPASFGHRSAGAKGRNPCRAMPATTSS